MNKLKKAINHFTEYHQEFEGVRQKNQRSSENVNLYYERKDGLAYQVMKLEQDRKNMVVQVAQGDIDSAKLSEVNEELNRLKVELAEAEELHEAANNSQESSAVQMREMQNGPMKRQKENIWGCVAEIEIEEATKSAIPQIHRAFIASCRAGHARSFDDFMKRAFNTIMLEERHWGNAGAAMEEAMVKLHQIPPNR